MGKFGEDLIASAKEALEIVQGKREPARVYIMHKITNEQLNDLIKRIEEGEGWDHKLDYDLVPLIWPKSPEREIDIQLTRYVDAAITFVEHLLPGWNVLLFSDCGGYFAQVEDFENSSGKWKHISGHEGGAVDRVDWPRVVLSAGLRAFASKWRNRDESIIDHMKNKEI
jgi:hypothetical protein